MKDRNGYMVQAPIQMLSNMQQAVGEKSHWQDFGLISVESVFRP